MQLMMILFTILSLTLSGQFWKDAERGDGVAPGELLPIAKRIFPKCEQEDSNNCVWDDGDGYPFFTINDVTIIFKFGDCGDIETVPCETWDEGERRLITSYNPYTYRVLGDR